MENAGPGLESGQSGRNHPKIGGMAMALKLFPAKFPHYFNGMHWFFQENNIGSMVAVNRMFEHHFSESFVFGRKRTMGTRACFAIHVWSLL
ncbi:MAG: hypothetical protein K0U52_05735 [Gammaproteobacteria bacterium]|nr:hypothetical protein [Gammaproteobacteria bacterium]